MLQITSVKIKKNKNNKTLLGIASVEFDNCLIVHNIQLVQLKDKRIISFPNRKIKKFVMDEEGYSEHYEYTDIIHPTNKEFREYIEQELFKVYDLQAKEGEQ